MNTHRTCSTCVFNHGARCANEASRYHGASLKPWNTCSAHEAPTLSAAELIERLATCAAGLDHRAEKAMGEYKPYFADRARQCLKWLDDLQKGMSADVDVEHIANCLRDFEGAEAMINDPEKSLTDAQLLRDQKAKDIARRDAMIIDMDGAGIRREEIVTKLAELGYTIGLRGIGCVIAAERRANYRPAYPYPRGRK